MPTACAVRGANSAMPFFSLSLDLDLSLVARMDDIGARASGVPLPARPAMVIPLDSALADAFLRLVELAECPSDASILAPLVVKEIHYRLLTGPFGGYLRLLMASDSPCRQIAEAMRWIRANFTQALSVENLAQQMGMAVSTFHKHFKTVTGISPLQFQKRLRLEYAQYLMLTKKAAVADAALAVGYESPQQFSREYKRLFGESPRRNIVRIRKIAF